jgi:predicted nucleic acid-binding protein
VKVAQALQEVRSIFLDTAPVIYYVERHPQYAPVVDEVFERLDQRTLSAVTSPITLAECLVIPYRLSQANIRQRFADCIVNGQGVTFVPLTADIASRAAELRAKYNVTLADACQVATALKAGCDAFLTNDVDLKRVQDITVLVCGELQP